VTATRMTREQAEEVLVRMNAALREIGAEDRYDLHVDSCNDPLCDCGWDVWWSDESDMSDVGLETLWRAYCTADAPDMMCLACWMHQFRSSYKYSGCTGDAFIQDCGAER
jgi:hypothetical protein